MCTKTISHCFILKMSEQMSVKEILENAMHLVIDLTVKKKITLEEVDLFSTFVGMFQYAILTDKKTNNDEPVTLIVVTDDTSAKKRMYEFAKSLLSASKLTRTVSNDLIWTNDIHIVNLQLELELTIL